MPVTYRLLRSSDDSVLAGPTDDVSQLSFTPASAGDVGVYVEATHRSAPYTVAVQAASSTPVLDTAAGEGFLFDGSASASRDGSITVTRTGAGATAGGLTLDGVDDFASIPAQSGTWTSFSVVLRLAITDTDRSGSPGVFSFDTEDPAMTELTGLYVQENLNRYQFTVETAGANTALSVPAPLSSVHTVVLTYDGATGALWAAVDGGAAQTKTHSSPGPALIGGPAWDIGRRLSAYAAGTVRVLGLFPRVLSVQERADVVAEAAALAP